jgi:hypothetical protein
MQISFPYKQTIKLLFFIVPYVVSAETEYEPNNTLEDASPIYVNEPAQAHKFDYVGDEDWLVFYAQKGTPYDIEIESDSVGQGINPALELYNENGEIEVNLFDFKFAGEGELLSWNSPEAGFYYIRVVNLETEFNVDAHYNIKVFLPFAPEYGLIKGKVIDQCTQKNINKAIISSGTRQELSHKNGSFSMEFFSSTYDLTARANGYKEQSKSAIVEEFKTTPIQFDLLPEAGCSVTPTPDPETPPINTAPTPAELEQLKRQAVAVYEESSRVLTIIDVRIGGDILAVSLIAQQDFSFTLNSVVHLGNGVSSKPAFFNFDSLLADIPQVFAFDKLFKVQLRRLSRDGAFVIQTADQITR